MTAHRHVTGGEIRVLASQAVEAFRFNGNWSHTRRVVVSDAYMLLGSRPRASLVGRIVVEAKSLVGGEALASRREVVRHYKRMRL